MIIGIKGDYKKNIRIILILESKLHFKYNEINFRLFNLSKFLE